jgi:hypothetical protein
MAIAPASEPVTLRVRDSLGGSYLATIPGGSFVAAPSGRNFKFGDLAAPYENGGVQKAYLKIGSDRHSVRYLVKSRGVALPSFAPGTGALTVRIGAHCFTDSDHTCALTTSGTKAKCE